MSGRACSAARSDFFERQPQPPQGAADGHEADRLGQAVAQLGQRGVGLPADQFAQAGQPGLIALGRGAAALRPRRDRGRRAAALHEAADPGGADGEALGDLAAGLLALVHGGQDTLAEVE
jgi:hypothetical protein